MNRRGFLGAILAAGMAPAIVKAANLMPVFALADSGLLLPKFHPDSFSLVAPPIGNRLMTIEMITAEALQVLENNLDLWADMNHSYDAECGYPVLTVRRPRRFATAS